MSKSLQVPEHIAIIMDGNGRWAKAKKLPRIAGHRKGAEVVKSIVKCCDDLGVGFLTLYTFSTENWKRPEKEINFLMGLLSWFLEKEISNLKKNNARFLTIGNIEKLPKKAREVIARAKEQTKSNTGLNLILALNYGARFEIIEAVKSICGDIKDKRLYAAELNEEIFSGYLNTAGIPDPDLLIRTSGEMRLSNFLLWQLSYSELYVTDKLWPDFNEAELKKAIDIFQERKRRFGGIVREKG
ncbi:MAG: isoprenyl transferase [Candidatus Omnitrophica bacterium]|nr:isoprenyl transferase [Candidatus Omnitrophota bacterium]